MVDGKVAFSELRRTLGDAVLVNETKDPPMKYLLCRAHDLADVTSRTAQTSKLPGVNSVRVTLNRENTGRNRIRSLASSGKNRGIG